MEKMVVDPGFWQGKRVFLTGHTGFKGSWLSYWLVLMGAEVHGYALEPHTQPSLYHVLGLDNLMGSTIADIRDLDTLATTVASIKPDVIIHMAAQPLVRDSYKIPVDTYAVNVMGTVNLLEAVRRAEQPCAVVNVTTDKCYENKEWHWGYRETEPMGGYDPYSNSKGCSELVTASYRQSFFNPLNMKEHRIAVASARAGNVIGGGDWAVDRLVPDMIRAFANDSPVVLRHPHAIRPWQHVLEPLSGYLALAQSLMGQNSAQYCEGWNFGPQNEDCQSVQAVVEHLVAHWPGASWQVEADKTWHEATFLKLDISKASNLLGWGPRWHLSECVAKTAQWYRAFYDNQDMLVLTRQQIEEYQRI
jgi:CDP-glucose 4,6-dehydratase